MVRAEDGPGKNLKMCVWLNFKYSIQGSEYQSDYPYEEICFTPSRYGGYWSEYELEDKVRAVLRQKIG